MRKCVSMVAVASAATGLTGCSGPDRAREPAGAAHPLSTASSAGGHEAAGRNLASGQDQGQGHDNGQAAVPPLAVAGTVPAAPISAPLLPPSGTTPLVGHPAPQAAADGDHLPVPDHAAAKDSSKNRVPPPALPAPPPPHPHASAPRPALATIPGLANLPYDSRSPAITQLFNAFAAAQYDGKPVLLDFGADWCPACKALDKAMQTPKARTVLAESYHVVHIDLGDGDYGNMMLASLYDAYGTYGMPLLIVLSPDGAVRVDTARSGQPKYDEANFTAWLKRWVR